MTRGSTKRLQEVSPNVLTGTAELPVRYDGSGGASKRAVIRSRAQFGSTIGRLDGDPFGRYSGTGQGLSGWMLLSASKLFRRRDLIWRRAHEVKEDGKRCPG